LQQLCKKSPLSFLRKGIGESFFHFQDQWDFRWGLLFSGQQRRVKPEQLQQLLSKMKNFKRINTARGRL